MIKVKKVCKKNLMIWDRIIYFFSVAFFSLLAIACAIIEKPNGGPADRTAPQLSIAIPADSSVNFSSDRITLEFDEFIKLNNPNSQIIINPFPIQKPEITIQSKKVKVILKDSLIPNTTYHIFFGNAVQDITENNSAVGLDYVFSTGDFLDSCSLSGYVGDAFTNKSTDKVWVMLYKNLNDFKDTLPVYIAHVNDKGLYKFRNIASGNYYLCALEDNNSNFKFDIPDEKIAFLNDPVQLSPSNASKDSVYLYLFNEASKEQKHLKTTMIHFHSVYSSFRLPMKNPEITILSKADEIIHRWNEKKDTLTFWIKGSDADSLRYIIRDGTFSDTLAQVLKFKSRMKDFSTDTTFKLSSSTKGDKIAFDKEVVLSAIVPLEHWQYDKILFIQNKDTLLVRFEKNDSTGCKWNLIATLNPGDNCSLILKKGAVTDFFGYTNDSTTFNFKVLGEQDLGSILIDLTNLPGKQLIVYAESTERNYRQYSKPESNQIIFNNLLPGEYQLKIIVDENNDREWSSGDFAQRKQPEKVFTLPRPMQVKKSWESKIGWSLKY